ncbi:SDR family oxidoreductase [Marivita lacus]|uniref:SDR family oxidoreductase n=1 Tax=Marivita lacus TaxID=1323742 RepID=A0ABQ1L0G7_9RHOB|nr:SDR family NAD(P)-dependent oxidoreductase [Marivita lacus]GGC15359.1 SDR family oxidoreductase [Marivita lacus]
MENALIIGSSGGIGSALTDTLTTRGVTVTGLSRSRDGLDVTDEASVEQALGALEGPFDLIFVATGALEIDGAEPEKSLRHITAEAMIDQFKLNTVGPSLVLKHAMRLLPRKGRSVFAALSARVGSIGDNNLGGWYSYRTSKAALNQMLHGAAIELGRTHKDLICVALHPGTVETSFTEKYVANHPTVPAPEAAQNLLSVLDGLTPEQTGKFFDWQGKEVPW